jgi:PEGA domain
MHLRIRSSIVAAGVALSVGLLTGSVTAQQSAAPSAAAPAAAAAPGTSDDAQHARAQLDNAERAYREGRYADAASAFIAADRVQPSPAIQLALGKTYEQMNDASRALAAYREYFARSPRAADRTQVQARVAALAAQLAEKGVQQISVSSVPAGATVIIDTKPLGTTPIYVDLPPGAHHLEYHLQNYESAALDFELSPQQPLNVMTTLVPRSANGAVAEAAAPAPAEVAAEAATPAESTDTLPPPLAAPAPKRDETTTYMRSFGFAALGGSVVTLGTAVAFELMRSHSESRARQQRQQIAFKDAIDTMHTQQTLARVFAVSAGVLAAAGGVLLVLAANRENNEPTPETGAAIACAPAGCSAVYQGRF